MSLRILKNEKGILTVDYIFAIVLAMSFMAILFALSLTLTVVDVVQYMTFSSARTYSVAHKSEAHSIQRAVNKYDALIADPAVAPFFKNKWFKVGGLKVGHMKELYPPTPLEVTKKNYYLYGTSVDLQAKVLDFKIPFYGSTHTGSREDGFVTRVHSFLGREPSYDECMNINKRRSSWINENYPSEHLNLQEYRVFADNGC